MIVMNDELILKLWVIKFCLKIIYPNYNFFVLLVYLSIKYRINFEKRYKRNKTMDVFKIKTISASVQRLLLAESLGDKLSVYFSKCLIVSKNKYIELAVENFYYLENEMLWVALKLSPDFKSSHEAAKSVNNKHKYDLTYVTAEIHKKLWPTNSQSCDKIRIVPIVGSKLVHDNIILATESEYFNILSTYGLNTNEINVELTFHPVPSRDCSPKIASIAEVNLLVNEFDLTNDFLKEILSNHFETPKLISSHDVFCVELKPDITGSYQYKYLDLVQSVYYLYFKCKRLTDSSINSQSTETINTNSTSIDKPYFIIKGVTQLTLGENLHGLKPKDEYFNQNNATYSNPTLLQSCPYCFKTKFNQIQETISPFLTDNLNDLLSSLTSPIIPMILLTGDVGSGCHLLVKTIAKYNGMSCLHIDCNALQSSTAKQTESKINATVQKAKAASPVIVLLDNFEVFAVDPENNEDCRVVEYFVNTITSLYQNYTKNPIIFIATTDRSDLKPNILRIFLEKFHINKLSPKERLETLQWFTKVMNLKFGEHEKQDLILNLTEDFSLDSDINNILQRIASKTETFSFGDIDTLVHLALRESFLTQHSTGSDLVPNVCFNNIKEEDFNSGLESLRSFQSEYLDAPKIPKVYWEDIGGLDKLKKELLKTIEFPIKYPHLFKNSSLKRSGILLYGPPGCGKTLVAKAVSTELNVSFMSIKGPELLNMYIGQSEENVRKVFESARASSPCIVFLDELDALAPRRGAAGDSGGASDRVVSQLLAEIDGVGTGSNDTENSSFVFIMGATNRPDLLEQSLLRPGRLDKLIYVGPYNGIEEKTKVLQALCRSHNLRPEVDLESVASALPDRCTGADLMQVVTTARSSSVRALVNKLQAGLVKEKELSTDSVIIGVSELLEGVKAFKPSVTDEELVYYESLQSYL